MVIKMAMDSIYGIFYIFLGAVDAFDLPQSVQSVLADIYNYIDMGCSYIAAYTHYEYLCGLVSAVVVINAAIFTYQCIMWLLGKVPFLGVH